MKRLQHIIIIKFSTSYLRRRKKKKKKKKKKEKKKLFLHLIYIYILTYLNYINMNSIKKMLS